MTRVPDPPHNGDGDVVVLEHCLDIVCDRQADPRHQLCPTHRRRIPDPPPGWRGPTDGRPVPMERSA